MLTTNCPKCEKEVTVPSSANAESRVRCPLCSEEYSLEHVFSDLPPLLELLDVPATNGATTQIEEAPTESDDDAPKEVGMFDFDQGEADDGADGDGGIAMADPVESAAKSGGFEFGESSSALSSSGGGATAAKARPRKKSSPMKAIIGVIIGGLFAIPIAQLTLWYLPGGWHIEQRDPMGLGRSMSGGFASFLVPSWVVTPEEDPGETAQVDPATANPVSTPTTDGNNTPEPDDEIGGLGGLLGQNGNNPSGSNDGGNQNGNENGDGSGNAGGNADGEPENGGSSGSNNEDDPPQPKSPVKGAPTYTASDLAAELKVVKTEVERFDDVYNEDLGFAERKSIRDDYFASMAKLAAVTTFADDKPDGHLEHLNEILQDSASTSYKRRIIGVSAYAIIKDENREADGIVIAGEVSEINKRGPLYEAVIAIDANTNPPISVYGTNDPAKSFRVGEKVMILGIIIDKPADKIREYKGPRDDAVVWGGYSQVVPTLNEE